MGSAGIAMATKLYLLSYLLIASLQLDFSKGGVHEEESLHHHIIDVGSLLPKAVCTDSNSKDDTMSTLKVAHRHGPCSPLGTDEKKLTAAEMLEPDQARVKWLLSRISGQAQPDVQKAQSTLPVHSGRSLGTGNYVVTVGLGTPKRDMTVVFDTASDLTWIQCEPCAGNCYHQQDKIFNPAQSSTYLNISCNSAECSSLRAATGATGCSSSTCIYGIQYGDQSYSVGFFGHETLTLSQTDKFPNFGFGCGQNNQGLFGAAAGLLGMGRNRFSLVSQTQQKYRGVFSYCLPSPSGSYGYLTFGGYKASPTLKFTPLLTNKKKPYFYFLDLIGIVVGGKNLHVSPVVFSRGGTIIDSGTVITRLPPSAYKALRSAFQKAMSKYPPAQALSILDTCYDLSKQSTITVPKIHLQFRGGAEIDVGSSGILVAASPSQVCLAFAGNTDPTYPAIIGNRQQQTIEVVYDLAKHQIGFGAGGCS